jgi:hypothetical protein
MSYIFSSVKKKVKSEEKKPHYFELHRLQDHYMEQVRPFNMVVYDL